jgi:GntR family transcriptional repressor for pyruvate dehydrogenase complex
MRILLADIAGGAFAAGERLPPETELVQQFAASRGVIREAVRGLEERGVVSVRHGHGAIVMPPRSWNLLDRDVLVTMLETSASAQVLAELLECRRILEVEAAGLAALRASAEDLTSMADALVRMNAVASRPAWTQATDDLFHEADVAFHNAIFLASGNRILLRVVEPIQRALYAGRRRLARPEARLERALPEHKAILSAIANRSPEQARAAMTAHLDTIESYLEEFAASVEARFASDATD